LVFYAFSQRTRDEQTEIRTGKTHNTACRDDRVWEGHLYFIYQFKLRLQYLFSDISLYRYACVTLKCLPCKKSVNGRNLQCFTSCLWSFNVERKWI